MIPRVGMHQTASVMMGDRISDTTCRDAPNGIRHDGKLNRISDTTCRVHQIAFVMMGDRISDTTCRDAPNGIRHDGRPNK